MIERRTLLARGVAGLAAATLAPRMAFAALPTDQRFVFIIQRGAADGLHIVPPLGDPNYAALRGPLLASLSDAHAIDATFSLHPALARTAALFGAKQALAVHAMASVYRDRSHFDGQNILETGGTRAYAERTGWLNRLIAALPSEHANGLALAPDIPLALRGPAPVSSYAPSRLPEAGPDLLERVTGLYQNDSQLAGLWKSALATRALAGADTAAAHAASGEETGRIAAKLLTPANGARVMMIETLGWDTHSAQAGRLNGVLRNLDAMIGALADGLGPAWNNTLVLVATEFGRTAAINGTGGTDHGTASAALLLGGALSRGWAKAGAVACDWPGLAPASLYQNRDLKPTMALESVICGALAQHFGKDPRHLARMLYPGQPGLGVTSLSA